MATIDGYLVARGDGPDRRWMDGTGPDSVFSWTPVRENATRYSLNQGCKLVDKISFLFAGNVCVELEKVCDGDPQGAVIERKTGSG